ncbi:hypothetical protein HC931_18080 [Candidatus Gracilibacteria bacterium]|nr:hypothetical protein [Candidatus Gracilibacteria bacterium]NJM90039.1 hypothetical protein [Hydrococcus sp. RU_2_2]NJP21709.1 hypothetical protein [Hydrococcus sp. CRU_1_1]
MKSETTKQFFQLDDRKKNLFRFCAASVFTGAIGGFWLLAQATPPRITQECLTSYHQQVGAIAFEVMKECNLR